MGDGRTLRWTLLSLLAWAASCGDDSSVARDAAADGGTDVGADGAAPADAGSDAGGDAGVDAGEPCVAFEEGVSIDHDVRFCAGTIDVAGDVGARIAADGVTVVFDGTELAGAGGQSVGIAIDGVSHVTVRGVTAHGFGYGLVARDAEDVTVEDAHLDDNFTDPAAGWVQDSVQGGGIRLERVTGGRVADSSFARNWNGIELRDSSGVVVSHVVADHCSNTGATLVAAHDCEISDSDMSWAVRGDGLDFPGSWYGIDTRDSAGIIVDAGSSRNRILRSDFRYGGDGIFLRAVIGGCATDNRVEGNDTSFSPHNAIESWCDGNELVDNVASSSHYGLWLGGNDRALVRGNTVEDNVVDGISIQIGEDRHSVIDANRIARSGRVGLLLTGREYQAWDPLTRWADRLASSGHLVVSRNTFEGNRTEDVFITSTRAVLLASNCGSGGPPGVTTGREAELVETVGSCGADPAREAPSARVEAPASVHAGASVVLDASASTPSPSGGALSFSFCVQRSGASFPEGVLPAALLLGSGSEARRELLLPDPGAYDVDVTVNDGVLGALAWRQIAVLPSGTPVGDDVARWTFVCSAAHGRPAGRDERACTTTIAGDPAGVDGAALHASTDAAFDFALVYPATRDLALDASAATRLGLFVRGLNTNELGGWQGSFPEIVLGGAGGDVRYAPSANVLPNDGAEWAYVEIPLAGGAGWTRTDEGGSLARVDWIELHADTWGFRPVEIWVDAMTLY